MQQLHENFAFLYDGLAKDLDDLLTPYAITLRDKLRADVKETQSLA